MISGLRNRPGSDRLQQKLSDFGQSIRLRDRRLSSCMHSSLQSSCLAKHHWEVKKRQGTTSVVPNRPLKRSGPLRVYRELAFYGAQRNQSDECGQTDHCSLIPVHWTVSPAGNFLDNAQRANSRAASITLSGRPRSRQEDPSARKATIFSL